MNIDKLLASGRITAEEADRLRTAPDPESTEQVLVDIRSRHASERLDTAVAEGAMTPEEAAGILDQVRRGDHSRRLRSHLAPFRRKRAKPAGEGRA